MQCLTKVHALANIRIILVIVIAIVAIAIGVVTFTSLRNRPSETVMASENSLPVVLVHGWGEDASIWKTWEGLLRRDGIQYYTITFQNSDDKCGNSVAHGIELGQRVQEIINNTTYGKVNIVGHSKGGLDARVYLANETQSVKNLIMIGTPNNGTPAAETTSLCTPATLDLLPGANATKAARNPNTNYYTIAGDWQPGTGGNPAILGSDDGLVPVSSVESEKYFTSLGRTSHAHAELLGEEEYNLARNVLIGNASSVS
jgi:pimeloyl-ACP methyl ester carboxylesterase